MPTVTPTPFMEYSDISSIATAVTSTFDVATLTGLIAGALGACVGLCLFWFAVRKVTRMVFGAAKKGKVRV